MKRVLSLCAIALVLLSWSKEKENSNSPKLIDFDVETTTANPSELLKTKYIKLQTADNCLIGTATQIKSTDKYIFVHEFRDKKIMAFDHSGKFIGNVGRHGKGPQEYNSISSFFIDDYNNCLVILDINSAKIIRHSLIDNFKYLSTENLAFKFGAMEITENGNIICNNGSRDKDDETVTKQFLIADKDFKVVNTLVDRGDIKPFMSVNNTIYKQGGAIFGYSQLQPIIYKLSETEAIPFYNLSFGDESLPPLSFFKAEYGVDDIIAAASTDYITSYSIYETSEGLSTQYMIGAPRQRFTGFWDRKTGKSYCYTNEDFIEKMGLGSSIRISGIISDYFVSSLSVVDVMDARDEGAEINETLSKLLDESKIDDNPILFLFDCK